ncbi:MAG: tRNA lysidine(34) synthetase TilS [Solirubrobacteraceae bacterium]
MARCAADVVAAVRATGLLAERRPVLVMLSGGRDSVCLLDLACRLAGTDAARALHVNHGLRAGADEDEAHCERLCAELGVELEVERLGRPPASGNVQAWARDQRYAAAARHSGAGPPGEAVAAGHTATDQVETILYRLAAAPGRRALLGMEPRSGRLVRPLLAVTREETAAYCRARGLAWREDPANESRAYARTRVREDLVAALRAVHPAAEANLLETAAILRAEAELLGTLVDGLLDGSPPARSIPLERLRAAPAALRRLAIQALADEAAGRPAPGAARRAGDVCSLASEGRAALDLPSGVRAVASDGVLRLEARADARPPAPGAAALRAP